MKKILFTAVGTTDPISNMHDGSYLHICRYHRPDLIILYLSAEMLENHEKDNRYIDAVERLNTLLGTEMQTRVILNRTLADVHLFDFFIQEFTNKIKDIQNEFPDSTLILNVSSGTPAMKSSLQLIAGLSEGSITAYQVATPVKRSNPARTDYQSYDPEVMWEYNEDNTKNENRIEESDTSLQYALIKLDMIYKLLDNYEYASAFRIASGIRKHLSERALPFLEAALLRTQLASDDIRENLISSEITVLYGANGLKNDLFEYVLSLQGKLRRNDYDGMLRAISPVVTELMIETLKRRCNLAIEDYCRGLSPRDRRARKRSYRWDDQKLDALEHGRKIKEILSITSQQRSTPYVANDQLLLLINKFSEASEVTTDLLTSLQQLRQIEETVRNIAAHQITKITDEWIKESCHFSSAEILRLIKKAMENLDIVENQDWAAYEKMNDQLKAHLVIQYKS